MKKGAWANIPPKSNRSDPICFSPYLYCARNQVERSSTGSNDVVGWRRATTGSLPTTLPSSTRINQAMTASQSVHVLTFPAVKTSYKLILSGGTGF